MLLPHLPRAGGHPSERLGAVPRVVPPVEGRHVLHAAARVLRVRQDDALLPARDGRQLLPAVDRGTPGARPHLHPLLRGVHAQGGVQREARQFPARPSRRRGVPSREPPQQRRHGRELRHAGQPTQRRRQPRLRPLQHPPAQRRRPRARVPAHRAQVPQRRGWLAQLDGSLRAQQQSRERGGPPALREQLPPADRAREQRWPLFQTHVLGRLLDPHVHHPQRQPRPGHVRLEHPRAPRAHPPGGRARGAPPRKRDGKAALELCPAEAKDVPHQSAARHQIDPRPGGGDAHLAQRHGRGHLRRHPARALCPRFRHGRDQHHRHPRAQHLQPLRRQPRVRARRAARRGHPRRRTLC
mmetsp:Transcript_24661/g.80627  ORF Transcript_24661/g.80627 Transcript_24661/m.80627 type:complete len:354 (+) Transcript_24661:2269-3330(+)